MCARQRGKPLGFVLGGCEGKAGGPPRTLPDTAGALHVEMGEQRADIRTGEAMPALCRREIIPDAALQFLNGRAEARDVTFGRSGQRLHYDKPAEMRRV